MSKEIVYVAMELWGGIFCLVIAFCSEVLWRNKKTSPHPFVMLLCAACMLFADSTAWFYRGAEGAQKILKISNSLAFFFEQAALLSFTLYLCDTVKLAKRGIFWALVGCNLADLAFCIITIFVPFIFYLDEANFYHRNPYGFALLSSFSLLQEMLLLTITLKERRKLERSQFISMLLIIVLPCAATAVQTFIYGYSLANIAIVISLIIFFIDFLYSNVMMVARQDVTIKVQKDKLRDLQTKIALSQIKPHFLYNALNSVYALCGIDVEKGRKALVDLSDYLRMNISSIESTHAVPFSKELSYAKLYLAIEALRFPKKLRIRYDIQTESFSLPALTMQPLVENAVKHGICATAKEGTLSISTREEADCFLVTVQDDGAGFDTERFFAERQSESHIGIRNVRERLQLLCNGTLQIASETGKGTTAVISLPKAGAV